MQHDILLPKPVRVKPENEYEDMSSDDSDDIDKINLTEELNDATEDNTEANVDNNPANNVGENQADKDEDITVVNVDEDSTDENNNPNEEDNSDEEDQGHVEYTGNNAESVMSLEDDMFSNTPSKRILPERTKAERKSISAVMLRTIKPLTSCLPKTEIPKGKWVSKPFVYKNNRLKKNYSTVKVCEVVHSDIPPDSDYVMVYNPHLDLVSLRKIMENVAIPKKIIQDTMIETKHGQALKQLSVQYIHECHYFRSIVNNAQLVPNVYTLVYGAVPSVIASEYVGYMLRKRYTYKDEKGAVPAEFIQEGELEIEAYCYTLLASSDLIKWKNDANRCALKKLLRHAIDFIPDRKLKLKVSAYIDHTDLKYITSECMLLIKKSYPEIITALRTITDSDLVTRSVGIWNCFMAKCGVHHYLCPHTQHEIVKCVKIISQKLINKLDDLKLQNSDYDTSGIKFTFEEIKTFFNFIPHLDTSTAASLKLAQKAISSIYTHIVKMFADHLVDYGIYPLPNKINTAHVNGFTRLHSKLISPNNNNIEIPIMKSKFHIVSSTIVKRIQQNRTEFHIEKSVKIEEEAICALMYAINMIILKRVEMLMYVNDRDISIGKAIHDEVQDLLESNAFTSINNIEAWSRLDDDEYTDGESSEEEEADDEPSERKKTDEGDEPSETKETDEGSSKRKKTDKDSSKRKYESDDSSDSDSSSSSSSSSSSCSSCSASDTDSSEDESDLFEEGQQLLMDLQTTFVPQPIKKPIMRIPKIKATKKTETDIQETYIQETYIQETDIKEIDLPNTTMKKPSNIKQISTRNFKKFLDKTPYIMKSENIPRILCVMCKKRRTLKAVTIGSDIEVACCMNCHRRLVMDYLNDNRTIDHNSIVSRIINQFKTPVAFDIVNDVFIKDEDFERTVTRNLYNRKLESRTKFPKRKASTKPTSASKSKKIKLNQSKNKSPELVTDDKDSD